ncbi:MAG: AAA family ATPase [Chloroflexota bacterium]
MKDKGRLLRTSEVAERLGVHTGTVAQYIREGSLPALSTSGGHYRIYEADLQAFLAGATLDREHGAVVIGIVNQKGGVGKTTAAANLSVLLSQIGMRVLAVDLDPQGHLTWTLGHNPDALTWTIYDAMVGEQPVESVILKTAFGPDLAPNNIVSSEAEDYLRGKPNWGSRLANAMRDIRSNYDYIVLDPGPNLSSLTINALYAADYLLIPTELEMLSLKGLQLLLKRVDETRTDFNPRLQVAGAVAMMVQPNTNVSRLMDQSLRQALQKRNIRAFKTAIKRSTKYGEASMMRQVMAAAHPRSEHTQAYKNLLAELLKVVGGRGLDRISLLQGKRDDKSEPVEVSVEAESKGRPA